MVVVVVLVGSLGAGLAAFKHNYDITHNLADIGQGKPVVVQIHDPSCQLCLQLRKNASAAVDRLDGQILFRVADITTPQGRALQRRHDVENVTLLLFDGRGKLRNVLNGVKSDELLHRSFSITYRAMAGRELTERRCLKHISRNTQPSLPLTHAHYDS